jgi:hypothetical protein
MHNPHKTETFGGSNGGGTGEIVMIFGSGTGEIGTGIRTGTGTGSGFGVGMGSGGGVANIFGGSTVLGMI